MRSTGSVEVHRRRFGGGLGCSAPLGLMLKGAKYVWLSQFFGNNTHLATRNPKFRTELDPEYGKDFFWSSREFGGKISE